MVKKQKKEKERNKKQNNKETIAGVLLVAGCSLRWLCCSRQSRNGDIWRVRVGQVNALCNVCVNSNLFFLFFWREALGPVPPAPNVFPLLNSWPQSEAKKDRRQKRGKLRKRERKESKCDSWKEEGGKNGSEWEGDRGRGGEKGSAADTELQQVNPKRES